MRRKARPARGFLFVVFANRAVDARSGLTARRRLDRRPDAPLIVLACRRVRFLSLSILTARMNAAWVKRANPRRQPPAFCADLRAENWAAKVEPDGSMLEPSLSPSLPIWRRDEPFRWSRGHGMGMRLLRRFGGCLGVRPQDCEQQGGRSRGGSFALFFAFLFASFGRLGDETHAVSGADAGRGLGSDALQAHGVCVALSSPRRAPGRFLPEQVFRSVEALSCRIGLRRC